MAKHIIVHNTAISIPGRGMVTYADAIAELSAFSYRPDVTVKTAEKTLYIEVVITNLPSQEKQSRFTEEKAEVLMIDLSEVDRDTGYEELKDLVLFDDDNKKMIHHGEKFTGPERREDLSAKEHVVLFGLVVAAIAMVFRWFSKK